MPDFIGKLRKEVIFKDKNNFYFGKILIKFFFQIRNLKKINFENGRNWISAWAFSYFVPKISTNLRPMSLIKQKVYKPCRWPYPHLQSLEHRALLLHADNLTNNCISIAANVRDNLCLNFFNDLKYFIMPATSHTEWSKFWLPLEEKNTKMSVYVLEHYRAFAFFSTSQHSSIQIRQDFGFEESSELPKTSDQSFAKPDIPMANAYVWQTIWGVGNITF